MAGACCSSLRQIRRAISHSSLARRQRLEIPESAAQTLGSDGLLDLSAGVVFRHPLARSAVYRAATADERSEAHLALADATDPDVDPDRRAWHRAQATSMPDEDVAMELEHSAARAQARGGFAAAAAFLERSSVLTLDPARRVGRALAAAQAKREAGAFDEALTLAATAEAGPLDRVQRAEVDLLRARISFASERGNEAPALLLRAAKDFEPFDARRAREIYLDALSAALFAGRLAGPCGAREVAVAARALPEPATPPAPADLLLDGLARMITEGPTTGTPALRAALAGLREPRHGNRSGSALAGMAGGASRGLHLGLRGVGLADDAPDQSRTRGRRARRASVRPQHPSRRVPLRRRRRGGRVARRGSERARRGDRRSHRPAVRRAHGRSVPRSRGRAHPIRRDRGPRSSGGTARGWDSRSRCGRPPSSTTVWRDTTMPWRRPSRRARIHTSCGSRTSRWSS